MAGRHNIVRSKGVQFLFSFTIDTDGDLWDLSTYGAEMNFMKSTATTSNMLEATVDNGRIVMNSEGLVSVTIDDVDFDVIPIGTWKYEFNLFTPQKEAILRGNLVVEA